MHLTTRNVNTAFRSFIKLFAGADVYGEGFVIRPDVVTQPSRNGNVLVIDEPVTITYTHPRERVLFNPVRDANPFFHLYEALWMLAGRNDVAPLQYYCSRMKDFSDDYQEVEPGVWDGTLNGAYGKRWRAATGPVRPDHNEKRFYRPGVDQLNLLVDHLKADPNSRRAVLQMWNVEDDLLKIGKTRRTGFIMDERGTHTGPLYDAGSKDVCCNLSVMFSLRKSGLNFDAVDIGDVSAPDRFVLDMTVTNRSNDLVWGLLGTNYVHFTILQEYMAARLGVEVGKYHHFTNNLHVYCDRPDWKPQELLQVYEHGRGFDYTNPNLSTLGRAEEVRSWGRDFSAVFNLVQNPAVFEQELPRIVGQYSGREPMEEPFYEYQEPFFRDVAQHMFDAWLSHKKKTNTATDHAQLIKADDWRIACTEWLQRRQK